MLSENLMSRQASETYDSGWRLSIVVEMLTKEMFSENLNSKFLIRLEGLDAVETELIEFKEFNMTPRQEQFSVLFRAPSEPVLRQGLFRVEHDKIGEFDLFLVPVRKDQDGLYYEAVFNRIINKV
jgi:hypothetical protein